MTRPEGLEFERAYVGELYGALVPMAVLGGVTCVLGTKSGLLEAGLAHCTPTLPGLLKSWPLSAVVEEEGVVRTMKGVSGDPRVLAAARRFNELSASGQAELGMALE